MGSFLYEPLSDFDIFGQIFCMLNVFFEDLTLKKLYDTSDLIHDLVNEIFDTFN